MLTAKESNQAINSAIRGITRANVKLDKAIQSTLLLVHDHVELYGDHDGFNRLVNALSKGANVAKVRSWVEACTWCTWDLTEKRFIKDKGKTMLPYAEAEKIDWREAKAPPKAYKPLDYDKAIKALLVKLEKDAKETGTPVLDGVSQFLSGLNEYRDATIALALASADEARKAA